MKIGTLELKGRSVSLVVVTPFFADKKFGARTKEMKAVKVSANHRGGINCLTWLLAI